jgi:hypothetical protein
LALDNNNATDTTTAETEKQAAFLLAPERWEDRQYENPDNSPAARFMKPLYSGFPASKYT